MTTITPFSNDEFQIDMIPDGDSFKVAAPGLAKSLGFRDAFRMLETMPEGEKGYTIARTPGGEQRISTVTEAGFYRAIGNRQAARVKDPAIRAQVERFQSWVYGEVLPSIRRHGAYMTEQTIEQVLTDPDTIIKLATDLKEERVRRAEVEAAARKAEAKIEAQAPAVAKAAAHSASKEWKGRQVFAREVQSWGREWGYSILQESVYELLRRKGMLVSGQRRDRNHATAHADKSGWAKTEKGVSEAAGKPWETVRLSPKGQDLAWKWINKAIEEYGPALNPKKEIEAA